MARSNMAFTADVDVHAAPQGPGVVSLPLYLRRLRHEGCARTLLCRVPHPLRQRACPLGQGLARTPLALGDLRLPGTCSRRRFTLLFHAASSTRARSASA